MFKKKELINKELELYKKEETLKIDEEIQKRKVNNWVGLDKVRMEKREEEIAVRTELAKLEAKKEFLDELNAMKDKEIATLKELVSDLITRLPRARAKNNYGNDR